MRTPKDGNFETMGTICVQTDQLEMHGDDSIQDSQGNGNGHMLLCCYWCPVYLRVDLDGNDISSSVT